MDRTKKKLLNKTYQIFLDSFIKMDIPEGTLKEIVSEDIMGFGTTSDEKIVDYSGYLNLIDLQRMQSEGASVEFDLKNLVGKVAPDGNSALFVEEGKVTITTDGNQNVIPLRFTTTLFYEKGSWKVIHWHGSTSVNTEKDTWHKGELQKKNEELEKLVDEKTADLESKKRELEIESAMERIRVRTLLMKDSKELNEAVAVFFKEFNSLNLLPPEARTYFCDINADIDVAEVWMTYSNGEVMSDSHHTPLNRSKSMKKYYEAWKRQDPISIRDYKGKDLITYLNFVSTLPHIKKDKDYKKLFRNPPKKVVMTDANFLQGNIGIMTFEPLSKEALNILIRFAKVFEFTYTRFLDLQKAEAQAREAQIEAGLEWIRSRTMGMQKSEELTEVAMLLNNELRKLGFPKLFEVGYIAWDEKDGNQKGWLSDFEGKGMEPFKLPLKGDWVLDERYNAWKNQESLLYQKIGGKELIDHVSFCLPTVGPGKVKQQVEANFSDPTHFYHSFFKAGAICVISQVPLDGNQKLLLQRFTKVFKQTYTRFLDLQKAEAQAREAQIEAALERVRSQTMAMQRSEELLDVATILFQQVKALGVPQWNCGFNIWDMGDKEFTYFPGSPDGKILPSPCKIPLTEHPVFRRFDESRRKGEDLLIYEKQGVEQEDHYQYMLSLPGVGDFLRSMQSTGFQLPTFQIDHLANFSYGNLIFITYEHFPEMHDVFKRFAKVFEQTYTRFLDLQQAEAQAREAQIEASLERVRSRSLAMHKSKDLEDVVLVVLDEINKLDITNDGEVGIAIHHEDSKDFTAWLASPDQNFPTAKFFTPYFYSPINTAIWNAKEKGQGFFAQQFSFKIKNTYFNWLFDNSDWKNLPQERKDWMLAQETVEYSIAFGDKSSVYLPSFTGKLLTESEGEILLRFSKVFEQAYTRFLDLQKAEAQAREAQIEAALEKVRSRSMAMQRSGELSKVAVLLFQQIKSLGVKAWGSGFNIWKKEEKVCTSWMAGVDGHILDPMQIPLTVDPTWIKFRESRLKGEEFWVQEVGGEDLEEHYRYFQTIPAGAEIRKIVESGIPVPKFQINHVANFSHGNLMFITFEPIPEAYDIFKRFAKVFEQTYTRFIDLKKAEAQAREAQIEAALERLRSRSLAMQESTELREVVQVLYTQLQGLNLSFDLCDIQLRLDDSKDADFWTGTGDEVYKEMIHWPQTNIPILDLIYNAWDSGKELDLSYGPSETRKFIQGLIKTGVVPESRQKFLLKINNMQYIGSFQHHTGVDLLRYNSNPFSQADKDIVSRFAKAFEQSYVRFLDLQKAEAQAREAQIEAALERVRSASLAMHESKDLHKVVNVVLQEMAGLEMSMSSVIIHEYRSESKDMYFWAAAPGMEYPEIVHFPYIKSQYFSRFNQAKEKSEAFFSDQMTKRETHLNWRHYFKHNQVPAERQKYLLSTPGMSRSCTIHKNAAIAMMRYDAIPFGKDENSILLRFGQVFQQSYQRFLDLQKAEAQAREAQIENALEKVRSRSLAMHNSDELQEVITTVLERLNELGLSMDSAIVGLPSKEQDKWVIWIASNDFKYSQGFGLPFGMSTTGIGKDFETAYCSENVYFTKTYSKKEKDAFYLDLFEKTDFRHIPQGRKDFLLSGADYGISVAKSKITMIAAISYSGKILDHQEAKVLQRFSRVFEQAYTRFLDLQKAEAQAREAQIETVLEKVRSRSMAMHSSEELADTASILFEQLHALGEIPDRVGICIINEEQKFFEQWITNQEGKYLGHRVNASIEESTSMAKLYKAWKDKKDHLVLDLQGQELKKWIRFVREDLKIAVDDTKIKGRRIHNAVFFSNGMFLCTTHEPVSNEIIQLLIRFVKVFEQAYTRFLDLQKAEAQAREAQIEAALERVRAKAMAMHSTKDISDATAIVFNELTRLGVEMVRCGIGILHDKSSQLEIWSTPMSPKDKKVKEVITGYVESNSHPMIQSIFEAWRNNESYFAYTLHASEVRDYYEKLGKLPGYRFPKITKYPDRQMAHCFYFEHGNIFVYSEDDLSGEQKQLLHRFTKVFSLTYKRYIDLKNAEAQVREAHIEAALERVRSKTMAMHNSHDVGATIVTLFDEVLKLGLDNDIRCGIGILKGTERMETWSATSSPNGEVDLKMGMLDMTIHPLLKRIKKAWESGEAHYADQMTGKSVIRYYSALNNEPDYSFHINLDTLPKKQYHNSFSFSEGILFSFSPNPMSEEAAKILNRFASVFGQTYRRYVDLLKAEEQAREAQIEAALERIRSKALAMQSSADLHGVSMILREQMGYLGQPELESSLIHLYNSSKTLESWYTFRSTETDSAKVVTDVAIIPVNSCEYIRETIEKYHSTEMEYTIVSKGKKLVDWYKVMVKVAPDTIEYDQEGKMLVPDILYYHHSKFIGGALLMISIEKPSEEAKELQRRAAKVFNLAYQRFIDFQQAEERARESLKQASLDRVRGEIASMRSKEDLNRITPLLWKELTALGVPFIRCGVFIMNENEKYIESHLSAPDGKSLGVLNLPYDANEVGNNAVKYWRKGEIYTEHWNKKQFVKFMQKMQKIGQMSNPDMYQGSASPPESLDLHFVPFKQGMLYVGSVTPLVKDEVQLVQSLAEAFSIAYARYEDFTHLEHAKNQIENALGELKSTQSQLIQSEKMASLGELTAGIAHEIQNPLNFVNNFSEVSKELIEEMNEEMQNGNVEEVKELTEDIKQNLDKIHHHGERASSIVKGMLEHSRIGDRKKEQTDINVLADEYLRLAYHGLRAKDKTFNADFRTELDESLPKIQVISQDISRVLLNLINNAFYTVSKKSKEGIVGYTPTVTVRTKKHDKTIELVVQDNGGGIPKDVVDKIFQPFFTTKPTGEGTGLGLSLSYDIVTQGHDGHLEVETEEGMGTRFIIKLPTKT